MKVYDKKKKKKYITSKEKKEKKWTIEMYAAWSTIG